MKFLPTILFFLLFLPMCLLGQDTLRICSGKKANFTADHPGGVSYQWDVDGDGTFDAAGEAAFHLYPIPDTFLVSLTLTDTNGCITSDTQIVVAINVEIDSVVVTHNTCINGAEGMGMVYASGGSGPLNYVWSDGQFGPIAVGLAAGNYKVTVSDTLGCDTILTVKVYEPLGNYTAEAGPTAYVIINSGSLFDPQPSVLLEGTVLGGIPAYTYNWTPVVNLSSSTSALTLASPTSTILYTLTVTDLNGCVAIDTVNVVVLDLNSDSLPTIPGNPGKVYVCHDGRTIEVNAGGRCSSLRSLCYHLNQGAQLGPCPTAKADIPEHDRGNEAQAPEDEALHKISVFPNPASESTTVRFQLLEGEKYTLSVVSMGGKIMQQRAAAISQSTAPIEVPINVAFLAKGMYLVQVSTDSGRMMLTRLLVK